MYKRQALPQDRRTARDAVGPLVRAATAISAELDVASEELDKRAGVHDLIGELLDAVERCDVEDMSRCLAQGSRVGLTERTHDAALQELLSRAHEYVGKFTLVHEQLVSALSGTARNPAILARAASDARGVGLIPNSVDDVLADECERLVALAENELVPMLVNAAGELPDRDVLERLLLRCEEEGLTGIPELAPVRILLSMDEEKLLQEQLRMATKLNDKVRAVDLQVRLRAVFLRKNPTMFRLDKFRDLRTPTEWAGLLKARRLRLGMLSWSATPIHAPLTKTCKGNPELRHAALRANVSLMRYMGDVKGNGGEDTSAADASMVLVTCLADARLRDEVYVQVMKQLTGNNSLASTQRGWNFMALCLLTFPPSSSLEYFLEQFLRTRAAPQDLAGLLDKLHTTLFTGERPTAPTAADVARVCEDGADVKGLTWRIKDVRREKRREVGLVLSEPESGESSCE